MNHDYRLAVPKTTLDEYGFPTYVYLCRNCHDEVTDPTPCFPVQFMNAAEECPGRPGVS